MCALAVGIGKGRKTLQLEHRRSTGGVHAQWRVQMRNCVPYSGVGEDVLKIPPFQPLTTAVGEQLADYFIGDVDGLQVGG